MSLFRRFDTPLDRKLLHQYDFFELYPLDGGGAFITRDILGSLQDCVMAANLNAGALEEFGGLHALDFKRYACWGTVERHCWLNRLYFLVPLAKNGQGELVIGVLRSFLRQNPAPQDTAAILSMNDRVDVERRERDLGSRKDSDPTEYQWYDFQPACRIVNTINAMIFLLEDHSLSEENWHFAANFIRIHGNVIFQGEKAGNFEAGNHQMLRGLALLYAGCLLKEPEWQKLGLALCAWHIGHDYLPDGMLHEISPSYHVFETWMSRDAVCLAEKYQLSLPDGCRLIYSKACGVCRLLCQPDQLSFVLNDGYPLHMSAFLRSIPGGDEARSEQVILPSAGLVMQRSGDAYMLFDVSPLPAKISHYHGGKNAVSIWLGGYPFVIDSACCNYDDPAFLNWYKKPEAHSSLMINGKGDSTQLGNCGWQCGAETRLESGSEGSVTGIVKSNNWPGIVWRRTIRIQQNEFCLEDTLSQVAELEFVFVLHPGVEVQIDNGMVILENGGHRLRLTAAMPVTWRLKPGKVCIDFREVASIRLCASQHGQGNRFSWHMS